MYYMCHLNSIRFWHIARWYIQELRVQKRSKSRNKMYVNSFELLQEQDVKLKLTPVTAHHVRMKLDV